MVCLRQLKTLQHSQLRVVAVTDVALLIVGLFRILRHQPLRLERLKLDNVNACLGSRVDKSFAVDSEPLWFTPASAIISVWLISFY